MVAIAIPFLGGAATAGKLANKAGRAMGKHVNKLDASATPQAIL